MGTTSSRSLKVHGLTDTIADSTKTSHTSTLPSDSKSTDPITSNTSAVGGLNLDDKSATPNSTSTDPHSSSTVPSTTRSTLLTYATTETPSSKELNMVNATKADPIAAVPEPSVVAGPGSGPSHVAATSPSTITSTGVAAQGGNYDASHAGAGKEANRRFPHIHHCGNCANETDLINKADPHTPSKSTEPAAPVEEKKSLKEKIKAKLHKHKD